MFIARDAQSRGDIRYRPDLRHARNHVRDRANADVIDEVEPIDPGGDGGDPPICYNASADDYYETTQNGTLFGGNPDWSAYAGVGSIQGYIGGWYWDFDWAQTSLYTNAPTEVDFVEAIAYVYINGDYAGYIYDLAMPGTSAGTGGFWSATCDDSDTLTIEVYTGHYIFSGDQGLYVTDKVASRIHCCP